MKRSRIVIFSLVLLLALLALPAFARADATPDGWTWDESSVSVPAPEGSTSDAAAVSGDPAPDGWTWDEAAVSGDPAPDGWTWDEAAVSGDPAPDGWTWDEAVAPPASG